jgi:hypothetical protein
MVIEVMVIDFVFLSFVLLVLGNLLADLGC